MTRLLPSIVAVLLLASSAMAMPARPILAAPAAPATIATPNYPEAELTIHNLPDGPGGRGNPTLISWAGTYIDEFDCTNNGNPVHPMDVMQEDAAGHIVVQCTPKATDVNLCQSVATVGYFVSPDPAVVSNAVMYITSACPTTLYVTATVKAPLYSDSQSKPGADELGAWTCTIVPPAPNAGQPVEFIDWWSHCSVNRPA